MPTGLLPEPLRVVGNNLFGRQGSDMSPTLPLARACLPLEPPRPLGVLWAQIGGGVLWPSLLPSLASGKRHRLRRCLPRRFHPPEEEYDVRRRPSWFLGGPAALHRSRGVHRLRSVR